MNTKPVLFIHGMFMNSECWNRWLEYFTAKGYSCSAPSWPYHDKPVAELRKVHPNQDLGKLNLNDVVSYYETILKQLPEQPILIGHSMGALVVQLLINKGYGACGIAIDSAPPKGVFVLNWSFLKANLPAINPLKGDSPDMMSFERFQYAFVNNLTPDEQRTAYDSFVVPESRNVPRSSTFNAGKIDFKKSHAPLLLIAGSLDHIIPASLNRKNYHKYKSSASRTDFKEFAGRAHFIIGQPDWQEVADYILNWIQSI